MTTFNPDNLQEQFDYFLRNQERLVQLYPGRYLVICNQKVVESFDDKYLAYLFLIKSGLLGLAIMQLCAPGPDCYTINIFSKNFGSVLTIN